MALESQIDAAARGDTKPSAGDVFDRFLDTVVDASPGQWATFTVNVIEHAHATDMPQPELVEFLDILGITSRDGARRSIRGKTLPKRGLCRGCLTRQDLQLDGRVRSHKRNGAHCPGRYEYPAIEPAAVAS